MKAEVISPVDHYPGGVICCHPMHAVCLGRTLPFFLYVLLECPSVCCARVSGDSTLVGESWPDFRSMALYAHAINYDQVVMHPERIC